jgi:hypothetical protein
MSLADKYPSCWREALELIDEIEKLLRAAAEVTTLEDMRKYLDQALVKLRPPTGA